jgi:hypothetical protein
MRDYQQFTPQVKIVKPKFIAAMRFQEREYHGSMPAGRLADESLAGSPFRVTVCKIVYIFSSD